MTNGKDNMTMFLTGRMFDGDGREALSAGGSKMLPFRKGRISAAPVKDGLILRYSGTAVVNLMPFQIDSISEWWKGQWCF